MLVDRIEKYLRDKEYSIDAGLKYEVEKIAGYAFSRQFMDPWEEKKGTLRLSSSGKCARQLAYQYHGYEKTGKKMDGRSKIVFWTGDLSELTIIALAKLSGCSVSGTGLNQIQVSIDVDGNKIKGHPDGVLFDESGIYLIEIKSMSSYVFERFENGEVPDDYLYQINCYMKALGLQKCVFVALNKESGVMKEMILDYDESKYQFARVNLLKVLKSTEFDLPLPPKDLQDPDKKGFYSWKCLYCAYWATCKPYAKQVLVGQSYKLKQMDSNEVAKEEAKIGA